MATLTLKFNRTDSTQVVMDIVEKDGEVTKIVETTALPLGDVPEILMDGEREMSLAAYGLLKLVQDRNSQLSNKFLSEQGLTGREAIEARIDAYNDTYNLFKKGLYKEPSQASAKGAAVDPIFAAAIAELKGCDLVAATTALKAADKDSRAALRKLPQVVEIIARMKKETEEEVQTLDLESLLS